MTDDELVEWDRHEADVSAKIGGLKAALAAVMVAADRQLRGMGRGKDPSPRLAAAFVHAAKVLGGDPTGYLAEHQALVEADDL